MVFSADFVGEPDSPNNVVECHKQDEHCGQRDNCQDVGKNDRRDCQQPAGDAYHREQSEPGR